MRRLLRWLRRFALAALVLAVVAIGAALIAVHTDWGRERAREIAEAQIGNLVSRGATIGRIEGSVLGELVLRDVELRTVDGARYAKIGVVRLELALGPLLGKTAQLDHLVVEDVELYPKRTLAPPVDPTPGTWSVELPALEVHRARIVIEDGPETVTIEGLDLTASASLPLGAPIEAAARVRGTWRERGAPFEGSVAAIVGPEAVTVQKLDVKVGGLAVRGADLVVDPRRPTGTLHVDAPASAVAQLVPGLALPGDVRLDVKAVRVAGEIASAGGEIAIDLAGGLGAARLTGKLVADLAGARVRGVVTAKDVALAEVTGGAHDGGGAAIVAFVADRARIRGTAIATGRVDRYPAGDAIVSFDASLDEAALAAGPSLAALTGGTGLVLASGADGSSARAFARLSRRDGALAIDAARVAAATPDVAAIAGAHAPVRGGLAVAAELGGTLAPLAITARGTLDGARVGFGERRADSITARRLAARFSGAAAGSLARATGEVTGQIRGAANAGAPLGDADLGARRRSDGTIAAWIRARPAAAPIVAYASGTIAPGGAGAPTVVALGEHAITMPGGEQWKGRGGRVVIHPGRVTRVTIERLRTANRGGSLEAGATIEPAARRLSVTLDATAVEAASIDPAYRGVASGSIRLERRGARWSGTASLEGRGLAVAPDATPLDADLRLKVDGRRVVLETGARSAALGGVRFELDVDGPRDLLDIDGWRRLPRAAVRSAKLGVDRVDLAAAAVPTGGIVDGTLYIAGADTTGTMTVRGMRTPLGDVEGDITFRPEDGGELGATSTVHVRGLGDADVSARIAFPLQPFDPAAWQRLGRGALAGLGASFSDIKIDPARLASFGIDAPFHGLADVSLVVAEGATSATVELDVTGVTGGPIVQPLDLHVTAVVDGQHGTRVQGNVHDAREPERMMLASFEAAVPSYTIDRWIDAPDQARHAPIAGGLVTVPGLRGLDGKRPAYPLQASRLLAVFGRADLASGTILGEIAIGGTLGAPTAEAQLVLSKLVAARRSPGKPAPAPTDLTIRASWDGARARVALDGKSGGGTLAATAEGPPTDLSKLSATITAQGFDLAPLAGFLPGELHAVEGKLGASLKARGLDSIAKLRGTLSIAQAVVPIHPMIGTLRDGQATAKITDAGIALTARGALGAGYAKLDATSAGHDLARITATGKLVRVSPLGEWEPVIDADLAVELRKSAAEQWTGEIKVRNASAVLPPSGSKLGDPDKPLDLLFVEDGPITPPRFVQGGRPPERPWLVADIDLAPMKIKAEDLFDSRGEVSGELRLSVGDTIGLVGHVDIENGIVGDLFGRRYTASGGVTFDGTVEPKVDIALQHKFRDLVLTVLLQGHPRTLVPEFRSDPPTYTRDQLAGFFIGGEPGGDPSEGTRAAATGASAAVLSTTVGARIRKRLPVRIEQLGCDPGNSVTAASCTVGRWFGEKLFVAFKRRIEVQENETTNANEVQGQYYLRRDLYLEMVGGDAGAGGLDLLWRRRW